jgi:CheY-like chemotaxis protein
VAKAAVLVLCGDSGRREGFVRALLDMGWEDVQSASSLADAAGVMSTATRTCVIVDAELRDIPGLKAVPILQQFCPHAKIIFAARENTRELEEQVRALNVFYYYISAEDQAELRAAVEEATGALRPARARPRPRILVVDDDHDYQATVRLILEAAGYEVSSAYSEPEGLDVARLEQPDVILLDIIMPGMDGFETLEQIKSDPEMRDIPVIVISALDELDGVVR